MRRSGLIALVVFSVVILTGSFPAAAAEETGGVLTFAVAAGRPTFDGHREGTFGLLHPIAPHYSLLRKTAPRIR